MKSLFAFLLLAASIGFAQNSAIPTQPFSFSYSAISLPGSKGTFVGSDAGVTFSPTQNFSIADHNILSSDGKLAYFGAGPDYQLPKISLKANNAMPALSGFRFLFSVGGSFGVARVKDAFGNVAQHYGEEAHGAFNYSLDGGGTWQLGIRAGAVRAPYYAKGWFPEVAFGPSFHF